MRRLICAFVVRIWHKQFFSWRGSYGLRWKWNITKVFISHPSYMPYWNLKDLKKRKASLKTLHEHSKSKCILLAGDFNSTDNWLGDTHSSFEYTRPCSLGMQAAPSSIPTSGTFFRGDLVMKTFLRPFSLFRWFKKSSCQLLAKECALSTGKLPRRLAQEQRG